MAKVFTGKVVIPSDKIDDYFAMMKKAEESRRPFRESLEHLNHEFHENLAAKFSERTAARHSSIIGMFIEFICKYTDAQSIEEITKGMVNTHFHAWWKRKVWSSTTPDQLRVALKKFFSFLASEKGVVNDKVLKAMK